MRLDKALTLAGYTRTEAKAMIARGRVRVAGTAARDAGMAVQPEDVWLDGAPLQAEREVYLMLNKPVGVVTATEDARLPTVVSLLPEKYRRRKIGPVGRLDRDVTGLVLLTTDGQLAHRLISPKRCVEKVYEARVEGEMDERALDIIRAGGIEFQDFVSKPAGAEYLGGGRVRLTLTEGKYHEVKRLCARVGHPVIALKRLSIAGVSLDPALREGQIRPVTDGEEARLYAAAGMEYKNSGAE